MPDCPTCQRPMDEPSDWLTADELALVSFLQARLAEHRDAADRHTGSESLDRETFVATVDLAASALAVVTGYAWTRDPARRAVLRTTLLLLSQPWTEHPDHAWLDELHTRLGV